MIQEIKAEHTQHEESNKDQAPQQPTTSRRQAIKALGGGLAFGLIPSTSTHPHPTASPAAPQATPGFFLVSGTDESINPAPPPDMNKAADVAVNKIKSLIATYGQVYQLPSISTWAFETEAEGRIITQVGITVLIVFP